MKTAYKVNTRSSRNRVLAKVEDWLDRKVGVKVLRLVHANNGLCVVDDSREQLKIIFPEVKLTIQDKTLVLGLILDHEKGWNLCKFKHNINNPRSSTLAGIIHEVGFEYSSPILAKLYSACKDSSDINSVRDVAGAIVLMMKSTQALQDAT